MSTYASSQVKRKSFYRKSELQMFLLISGGHIRAPKRSWPTWRLLPWVPETFLARFLDVSAFGQHRKFPPHARKTSGTQGRRLHTKLYKGTWNVSANNSETVGHKDLRLGQIVKKLVFYNISFSWLFHWTVSNLFFCCVTVKTIYRNVIILYISTVSTFLNIRASY